MFLDETILSFAPRPFSVFAEETAKCRFCAETAPVCQGLNWLEYDKWSLKHTWQDSRWWPALSSTVFAAPSKTRYPLLCQHRRRNFNTMIILIRRPSFNPWRQTDACVCRPQIALLVVCLRLWCYGEIAHHKLFSHFQGKKNCYSFMIIWTPATQQPSHDQSTIVAQNQNLAFRFRTDN